MPLEQVWYSNPKRLISGGHLALQTAPEIWRCFEHSVGNHSTKSELLFGGHSATTKNVMLFTK